MNDSKAYRLSVCLFLVGALAFLFQILVSHMVHAQSTCTAPTSNNQYWAPGTTITVFIDPNLSQQEQAGVNAAVTDWNGQSALTGNGITMTTTSTDPGPKRGKYSAGCERSSRESDQPSTYQHQYRHPKWCIDRTDV
jgi:hypothetical protein